MRSDVAYIRYFSSPSSIVHTQQGKLIARCKIEDGLRVLCEVVQPLAEGLVGKQLKLCSNLLCDSGAVRRSECGGANLVGDRAREHRAVLRYIEPTVQTFSTQIGRASCR